MQVNRRIIYTPVLSTGIGGSSVTLDVNGASFQSIAGVSGGGGGNNLNGITGVSTTATSGILVAFVLVSDTVGLVSISDGAGLTWTKRGSSLLTSDNQTIEMWSAPFSSAVTSDSMGFNTTSNTKFAVCYVQAFTGNNVATPFDPSGQTSGTPTTTITTSHASDMLLGFASTPGSSPSGGGAGWTTLGGLASGVLVEVKSVSATQAGTSLGVTTTGGSITGEIGDALQGT